jgi:hypothetical protein
VRRGTSMAHWSPLDWMFLGYSLMWGVIVLYVGNLQRRQAAVQREVAQLRAALEGEASPGAPAADSGRAVPAGVRPSE